jgi:hypothetical protein
MLTQEQVRLLLGAFAKHDATTAHQASQQLIQFFRLS